MDVMTNRILNSLTKSRQRLTRDKFFLRTIIASSDRRTIFTRDATRVRVTIYFRERLCRQIISTTLSVTNTVNANGGHTNKTTTHRARHGKVTVILRRKTRRQHANRRTTRDYTTNHANIIRLLNHTSSLDKIRATRRGATIFEGATSRVERFLFPPVKCAT